MHTIHQPDAIVPHGDGSIDNNGLERDVRVEDIKEPTMQDIRYLDKLIDKLAKGKSMEKILREK